MEAILGRDFDAVERALELVIAAGRDGPSVDRLRAMTALVKGDRTGALRLLDRARHREEKTTPRTAIATALVLIETGELGAAVRQALHALALARAAADQPGERAAIATMAACYRKTRAGRRRVRPRGREPPRCLAVSDLSAVAQGCEHATRKTIRWPACVNASMPWTRRFSRC